MYIYIFNMVSFVFVTPQTFLLRYTAIQKVINIVIGYL